MIFAGFFGSQGLEWKREAGCTKGGVSVESEL